MRLLLANVFYRLRLIEAYGTGIRKIMKAYEKMDKKPMIETTSNAFKITLPNINAQHEAEGSIKTETILSLNEDESTVLEFVRGNGSVTRADVEKQLGVSASTASRLLRRMVEKDALEQHGKGRSVKYILSE